MWGSLRVVCRSGPKVVGRPFYTDEQSHCWIHQEFNGCNNGSSGATLRSSKQLREILVGYDKDFPFDTQEKRRRI